mmetsp:Transcript_14851/g.30834  ORF Transcript_14851/g.30834 Transcript_14851/m.30834 type:complete len:93 (+) Transcript_14851:185-463(+)
MIHPVSWRHLINHVQKNVLCDRIMLVLMNQQQTRQINDLRVLRSLCEGQMKALELTTCEVQPLAVNGRPLPNSSFLVPNFTSFIDVGQCGME